MPIASIARNAMVLTALAASGAHAAEPPAKPVPPCAEAKRGGPGDVVRALYAAYPWEGAKAVQNEPREVLSRYFDEKFTELLIKDQECVRRYGGDLCNISVAILIAAQDHDIVDFRICTSKRGAEWIDVRFRNFGKDVMIAFRTTKTKAGWRIADIVYEDGGSLAEGLAQPL